MFGIDLVPVSAGMTEIRQSFFLIYVVLITTLLTLATVFYIKSKPGPEQRQLVRQIYLGIGAGSGIILLANLPAAWLTRTPLSPENLNFGFLVQAAILIGAVSAAAIAESPRIRISVPLIATALAVLFVVLNVSGMI